MNTVRQAAAWTYRILITLFAAAVIVEVFLAGLGAFHAVTAVLVLGLALFLTVRAWRGNLLIPPAQLRRIAPVPVPAASMPAPTRAPSERVQ
jgi:hypothetical protein